MRVQGRTSETVIASLLCTGGTLACVQLFAFGSAETFPPSSAVVAGGMAFSLSLVAAAHRHTRSGLAAIGCAVGFGIALCWLAAARTPVAWQASHLAWSVLILGGGVGVMLAQWILVEHPQPRDDGMPDHLHHSSRGADLVPLGDTVAAVAQGEDWPDRDVQIVPESVEDENRKDEPVLQSWTRFQTSHGERIEGMVRVEFRAGERLVRQHLPIMPGFTVSPRAWCETADDEISAEFDLLQPYGVRVTVRRRGDLSKSVSTELSVLLEACTPTRRAG